MPYNPNIHHRKSIRLKGYDYSQAGMYFITICCQNRISYFGHVDHGKMILNDAGQMIEKWYYELENKFPDIRCHEMVVMPNHFHCIVENIGAVGADLRVCPNELGEQPTLLGEQPTLLGEQPTLLGEQPTLLGEQPTLLGEQPTLLGEHVGSPLRAVVQWFKTMTTNEYIRGVKNLGWKRFDGKLWQRNYWEHIMRDEKAYQNISNYIIDNPKKWDNDKLK